MMITFKTVEDYIEVIAGERDMVTQKPTSNWISEPIISLARYDTDVVAKMSAQTLQNIGYTEKQAKLAQKIVLTYKRQLAQKNIDVTPVENPVYRMPIREMDYSLRLYIEDDFLMLRFPYNQKIIEQVRAFGKESQGRSQWNPDKKVWQIALTEYNLSWMYAFGEVNNFEIAAEVKSLFEKVQTVEAQGYAIELAVDGTQLVLKNAPESLLTYIQDNIGDISFDNVLKLIDQSSILGFTVEANLADALAQEYGHRFFNLLSNRELKLDPSSMLADDNFASVLDYAIRSNRLPLYIYEPDLSNQLLKKVQGLVVPEELLEVKHGQSTIVVNDNVKVVHITKPIRGHKIPLLLSTAGMIYGGEKEVMVQESEKIVYCAAEVYSKKNTSGVKVLAS